MGKKIKKQIDEPAYDPIQEEYASKQDIINRLFESYISVKNGIENSGLRGKHEARTELDKNHCVATIARLKHEICDTVIGAMWIKLKCPKFKDMVNTVIDTYLYDWINQEAELEQIRLEFSDDPTIKADEYKYNIYCSKVFKEKITPFLKMYFEIIVLQNIIKRSKLSKNSTPFDKYLTPNAPKGLMKALETIFRDRDGKGKKIAVVIKALIREKFITPPSEGTALYASIRECFGISFTKQACDNYYKSGTTKTDTAKFTKEVDQMAEELRYIK